jgi:HTH-type transcriptional regulator/antitoxin HigA
MKTVAAPIRPLRSDADYEAALDAIERQFDNEPKPGTAAADRFDLLALVIDDYERKQVARVERSAIRDN